MTPSPLHVCPRCESFNPRSASACVSCDTQLGRTPQTSKRTSTLLKTAGLVAMSITLTACYGGGAEYPYCVDENMNGYCDFEPCDDPEYDGPECVLDPCDFSERSEALDCPAGAEASASGGQVESEVEPEVGGASADSM